MPTVKELRAMAKARGLRGYSTMNKGPLEQLLGLASSVANAVVGVADTVASTVVPPSPTNQYQTIPKRSQYDKLPDVWPTKTAPKRSQYDKLPDVWPTKTAVSSTTDAVDEWAGTGARKPKPIGDMGRPQPGGEWAHLFDEDGNYTPPKDPSFKRTKRAPTPFNPDAFDVFVHERATDYQLYLYPFGDEQEVIQKAEELGRTTNLATLAYDREMLPLYAAAYARVFDDNANLPEEDVHMNKLFDMDKGYDWKHGARMTAGEYERRYPLSSVATAVSSTADAVAVYFGESMTTERRIQRPDWAKFQTDNDMRITLEEYVDAENSAIEDFRDRHDDYPEEDDPEFRKMVLMRARWITYNADTGDEVPYLVFIEAYKHATRMYEKEYGGKGDLNDSAFFQYVSDYVDMAMGK